MNAIASIKYIRRGQKVFKCAKILSVSPASFRSTVLNLHYSSGSYTGFGFIFVNIDDGTSIYAIKYHSKEARDSDLKYINNIIDYHVELQTRE